MRSSIIAAALLFSPAPASTLSMGIQREAPAMRLDPQAIPYVACFMGVDKSGRPHFQLGSGAWIGNNLAITADHVVHGAITCTVGGSPAKVLREYGNTDFAVLSAYNQSGIFAPISCDGIIDGHEYEATGYAFGDDQQRAAIWTALPGRVSTSGGLNGINRFVGIAIEGMSGGPVTDRATGKIVGIVNAFEVDAPHEVWGRSLVDTYLCKAKSA